MLYFVATPIGNLDDITLRAIEVLKSVDCIYCEDTRHSLKLLNKLQIKKPLFSYHKFNEKKEAEEIIEKLNKGLNIAVISDAGMPVISDPGNVLTKRLVEEDVNFTVVPGATAFASALILSGLDASRFTFIGLLPEKAKDRDNLLKNYKNTTETLIFYSAPHDINDDLKDLYNILGDRKVAVVKEITKMHEMALHFNLKDAKIENPKGEFVIVVEGGTNTKNQFNALSLEEHINFYIESGLSKKDAIKKVAEERSVSKNSLYKYTIEK